MSRENNKNEYARHVALFLAELLRTRRISLDRAAEISQRVVENLNLIDTENHFLEFVKHLAKDFQELFPLEDRINLRIRTKSRSELEKQVEAYATHIMSKDLDQSLAILQEAAKEDLKLIEFYAKFPDFKLYIESINKIHAK
jgi:hypothetical protein